MLQMFTSSNFSLSLAVLLALRAEFYTHFICTHGTQINYKCELSSKLFKDHLYCSLWSHLLSLTLNHTVFMHRIVLHFKLYTVQIGLYIYYIPILCVFLLCKYGMFASVCVHWGFYVCVCVRVCAPVCPHCEWKGKCTAPQLFIPHWQSMPAVTWIAAVFLYRTT